ncbi:hypothetical protein [Mycolicibacterium neoaurum]|uniref:Uncharacterized protein n=1 Tax=Mycolicibacterium neoaurum TaxID=1795 RepID=A0AAV2WGA0_MYCNE|nr:hypothetical protein [Mycolicibacterium neoaurum]CDQ43189.1 hypothetical protein BN1047_01052 [Mycolicibacterium neoaurum]
MSAKAKRDRLNSRRDKLIQTLRDTGMSEDEIAAELGVISLNQAVGQRDSEKREAPAKSDVAVVESSPDGQIEDDGIIDAEIVETLNLPALIDGESERMERGFHAYPSKPNRTPDGQSTNPAAVAQHDSMLERNAERRCTATNAKGNRCRKIAIMGSSVCRNHGGSARQVVTKARVRVEMASNRLMGKLIEVAFDDTKPAAVQLDAIKDSLNRAGLKPREQVEVGPITAAEEIFSDIFTGTRAESRRARGFESPDHEIDSSNLVDHVLGSPSPPALVDDYADHADYGRYADSDRPPAPQARDARSHRQSHQPGSHIVGEDALRIAADQRALPRGESD